MCTVVPGLAWRLSSKNRCEKTIQFCCHVLVLGYKHPVYFKGADITTRLCLGLNISVKWSLVPVIGNIFSELREGGGGVSSVIWLPFVKMLP